MAQTFSYDFDELPLVIEDGFHAGLIAGSAEIAYSRDGGWSVRAIYLDGYRERTREERAALQAAGVKATIFERKPVQVGSATSLFKFIKQRLETDLRQSVQDAVTEAITDDRTSDADNAADYRRDMRECA